MDNVDENVEEMKEVVKALGFLQGVEKFRRDRDWDADITQTHIDFVASVLNIERSAVEEISTQRVAGLRNLFTTAFSYFFCAFSTANPEITYNLLMRNSIIKDCYFLLEIFLARRNDAEAVAEIFLDPTTSLIYSYLVKYRFIYEFLINFEASLTVIQDRPRIPEPNKTYTLQDQQTFLINQHGFSDSDRSDKLLVIGCNKHSSIIDINLFHTGESEKALLLLIPDGGRLFMADISPEPLIGLRIKSQALFANSVIRMANNFFLGVLTIKCGYEQLIELENLITRDIYKFTPAQGEIFCGSSKFENLQIRIANIEGVGKKHCKITYSTESNEWILQDLNSLNGTWLLLKSLSEFNDRSPSEPVLVKPGSTDISIGSQKLLLRLNQS